MQKNYKRLGDYIQELKTRNSNGRVSELLGINIDNYFMPSVANVVGTDLTKYKIVKKNQFSCNRMHIGRDYRIPIAMSKSETDFIVSPAYDVFEIIDTDVLLPEYLMMWFSRSEFDRNAWFYTDGDVRGGLSWNAFCDFKLPIPDITQQQAIVDEYQTIERRIQINEELCQKLEETAQALYRKYFIDDIDPENLPEGWRWGKIGEIVEIHDSKRIPIEESKRRYMKKIYPYYGAASLMDYVEDYIFDGTYILLGEDGSVMTEKGFPVLQYVWGKFWVNNHAHVLQAKNGFNESSLYILLRNTNIKEYVTGGVQAKISQTNLTSIPIIIATDDVMTKYNDEIDVLFNHSKKKQEENQKLKELLSLLLAKMGERIINDNPART